MKNKQQYEALVYEVVAQSIYLVDAVQEARGSTKSVVIERVMRATELHREAVLRLLEFEKKQGEP